MTFNERLDEFGERLELPGMARAVDDRWLLARIAFWLTLFALLNYVVLVVVQFSFGEPIAGVLSVCALIVGVVAAIYMARTGQARAFILVNVVGASISVVLIHIALGGFAWSGNYLMWGITNVVIAALWMSRGFTASLAIAYLGAALVLAFLEPSIQGLRDERPDPNLALANTLQIYITTVLLVTPAVILLGSRIFDEKRKSRALMLNILPESIADRLQDDPGTIADTHKECTVLFADLVGFTEHSQDISAQQLVSELNEIFVAFDQLVAEAGGEKIKTMGDGYMAAFGVPDPLPDHVEKACRVGLGIISELDGLNGRLNTDYRVRVGIATGNAVAGVIGESKFSYDVWSTTVTLASRLERAARPNTVLVSEDIEQQLNGGFSTTAIGHLDLKGLGTTPAYELTG